jgi:hypothetical protein
MSLAQGRQYFPDRFGLEQIAVQAHAFLYAKLTLVHLVTIHYL